MKRPAVCAALVYLLVHLLCTELAAAHPATRVESHRSITDRTVEWPSWADWRRVLLLADYNTRVVVLGTTLLGCAGGMVGSFTLLRKRALMGDALSHATLPGIGLAFVVATSLGGAGKSLPVLLLGATATGLIGVAAILLIRHFTRLKEDTALGAVLSVFFGAGVALLGVIQQMKQGHAAGLESFIYGKTASMGANDTLLIGAAALICIGACLLLFKEFKLLCFDDGFAGASGLPVVLLDVSLMGLVVTVCIVGLQAVGLILVVALLVIPAAAARFWTEKMSRMFAISGGLGAAGGVAGAVISALFSRLPSGAMIVLVYTAFFFVSMVLGSERGVLIRWLRRLQLNRSIDHQHLLRAIYELGESSKSPRSDHFSGTRSPTRGAISTHDLLLKRSWSPGRLQRAIRRAERDGSLAVNAHQIWLTQRGMEEAVRLTRQHRLWELYLITYADVAPGRVDRDADAIEHVLEPEVIAKLESLLEKRQAEVPASPHKLTPQLERTRPASSASGA